jgi:hypothetical protein
MSPSSNSLEVRGQTVNSKQLKVVSAGVGAGAAVVMCVLGVAFSTVSSAQTPEPGGPTTSPATIGQTVTATVPPTAAPISEAKPSVTGPAPLPPEEQGLPG